MALRPYLEAMVSQGAADMHLKAGGPAHVRVGGDLLPLSDLPDLAPEDMFELATELMDERVTATFERELEADFAHGVPGLGRFRINIHRQRGSIAMTVRAVLPEIPDLTSLGLPNEFANIAQMDQGLLLVTGPGGSGKTTTMAAFIGAINRSRKCRVVVIEDNIEFVHADDQAVISQREVGLDTPDLAAGVRSALYGDVDVIVVSDIRDVETAAEVLRATEAGIFVVAGLRTMDADSAVERITGMFPVDQQHRARLALASSLLGILSQRLLLTHGGADRVVVAELLLATSAVTDEIMQADDKPSLVALIDKGAELGMQSFDDHLRVLVEQGRVALRDAVAVSRDPYGLRAAARAAGITDE